MTNTGTLPIRLGDPTITGANLFTEPYLLTNGGPDGSTEVLQRLERGDRITGQIGADGEWYKWSGGHIGVHGGVDLQAAQRTDWQSAFSALGGVAFRRENMTNARELRLSLRYFSGPSPMGEFFLTKERFLHFELMGRL